MNKILTTTLIIFLCLVSSGCVKRDVYEIKISGIDEHELESRIYDLLSMANINNLHSIRRNNDRLLLVFKSSGDFEGIVEYLNGLFLSKDYSDTIQVKFEKKSFRLARRQLIREANEENQILTTLNKDDSFSYYNPEEKICYFYIGFNSKLPMLDYFDNEQQRYIAEYQWSSAINRIVNVSGLGVSGQALHKSLNDMVLNFSGSPLPYQINDEQGEILPFEGNIAIKLDPGSAKNNLYKHYLMINTRELELVDTPSEIDNNRVCEKHELDLSNDAKSFLFLREKNTQNSEVKYKKGAYTLMNYYF